MVIASGQNDEIKFGYKYEESSLSITSKTEQNINSNVLGFNLKVSINISEPLSKAINEDRGDGSRNNIGSNISKNTEADINDMKDYIQFLLVFASIKWRWP